MSKTKEPVQIPERKALEAELERLRYAGRFKRALRSTIYSLIVVAAVSVLIATLVLPFLRIYGKSMTPTLENGNVVACIKTTEFRTGDVIAFYYNNKILVKRVIGQAGDYIDLTEEGDVIVNGVQLDEPYISQKSLGECDIKLPYQVPESSLFVMGDHRDTSIDSRSTIIGYVSEEQIVGRVVLRIWPLNQIKIF